MYFRRFPTGAADLFFAKNGENLRKFRVQILFASAILLFANV